MYNQEYVIQEEEKYKKKILCYVHIDGSGASDFLVVAYIGVVSGRGWLRPPGLEAARDAPRLAVERKGTTSGIPPAGLGQASDKCIGNAGLVLGSGGLAGDVPPQVVAPTEGLEAFDLGAD